jgi:Fe-S oxidoreductase
MKTWEYLRGRMPGTGILLGCCGGPAHGIGDQTRLLEVNGKVVSEMKKFGASELIVACPHCYHIFKDHAPDIHITSLYEIIAQHGLPEKPKASDNRTFSLHDSCNTRFEGKVQDSVREVLKQLGYAVHEPKFSREMTRCCGMGGMIAYVDFKLVNKIIMRRAKEMPHDVVTYCATCRDAFSMVGKPAVHILDLVFNSDVEKARKTPPKQGPAKQQAQSQLREMLTRK